MCLNSNALDPRSVRPEMTHSKRRIFFGYTENTVILVLKELAMYTRKIIKKCNDEKEKKEFQKLVGYDHFYIQTVFTVYSNNSNYFQVLY